MKSWLYKAKCFLYKAKFTIRWKVDPESNTAMLMLSRYRTNAVNGTITEEQNQFCLDWQEYLMVKEDL